jgi:hypothetical protein
VLFLKTASAFCLGFSREKVKRPFLIYDVSAGNMSASCGLSGPGVGHSGPLSRAIVTVKVKVTLEQTMKAQRGSRGIALLFL